MGRARRLKILALFDITGPTTIDRDLTPELKTADWQTESDVLRALATLGHTVEHLAIFDDLSLLRSKIESFAPDVIFNLADQFKNNRAFDQHIVSYLELHGIPFTGCGSTALTLCKHKAISKKILGYHGIRVPEFATVARGDRPVRPRRLKFPVLVKPLDEEASLGISQASFVENDDQFRDRVQFIHESIASDAIAEEYIEGRELYVSILGDKRLRVFPIRELVFREVPPDEPKIATYKAKWDEAYRKKWGLENRFAEGLDPAVVRAIERTCRRIYRLLTIDAYGRIDLRLTPAGEPVFIEANPNPMLADGEDFAASAAAAGLPYPKLIAQILRLGLTAERG
ncbi:MAG: D-alanine--D-alanine ligase [Planctomycetes bacterium]|nr:D-alanine--D-alanine ligase [Planctomycetota bacterium]